MLLLGIDTSGETASAALYGMMGERFLAQETLYTEKTHSQVIMPMCKRIIEQAGYKIFDLQMIAAANGPGSYTGLRIGVAAVKAMCYALGIECCGVSTLEGLAWNNIVFRGRICSIMKARGELVYTCTYKNDRCGLISVCEEKIMERSALAEYLNADDEPVLLCGDGAEEFWYKYSSGTDEKFICAPSSSRLQNAAGVCLAALSKLPVPPEQLEVSYLQKVKAEKDLEMRKGTL